MIAGTGANSTAEAIELTRHAQRLGLLPACLSCLLQQADAEGLYQHFRAIAGPVDLPVILYNVPGRTVADMNNDTALRLAGIPNIVGIKDATGNIERGTDLVVRAPRGFAVYSGDDASACALILLGAQGTISVTANVAPRLMHEMRRRALAGDARTAQEINARLLGLPSSVLQKPNPIPVKWACQQRGLIRGGIRLPLTTLSAECHERVRSALRQSQRAGLIRRLLDGVWCFARSKCCRWVLSSRPQFDRSGIQENPVQIGGQGANAGTPPDLVAPSKDDRFAVPRYRRQGSATFSAYANERSPRRVRQRAAMFCRR